MIKLKKKGEAHERSLAHYERSEYTTDYGAIIFDNTRGGNISNANIYRLSSKQLWHVDFYVDKEIGTLKSIWFVLLKVENMTYVNDLEVSVDGGPQVPFFDLSCWKKEDGGQWPLIESDHALQVYHNGNNLMYFGFGDRRSILSLNSEIALQFDEFHCLTGILINNPIEVPKLLGLM